MSTKHSYKSLFGFTRKCEIEIILRNEDHDGIPIVIAPGFLTENQEDWLSYIEERIKAPLIYVKWRSSSITQMTQKSLVSLLPSLAIPIIGAYRVPALLSTIYSSWSNAAKEASLAGRDLSRVLNDIWDDDDKAIFIGHSLGVRVITEAMRSLKHDNVLTSISIAGAIDSEEYDKRILAINSKRIIKHTNMYSDNDAILKWLYRIGELNYKKDPIGLVRCDLDNVINYKSSIGHTEYHEKYIFSKTIIELYDKAIKSLVV
ncbi:TPA: DUF726 domain-containing protein [Enterobacter roggenkampii]|uniref:DUF726 domain-containing protein n=1 Tax=Enterobacter cloacae complex TaxID=354276 RepID=UPI002005E82C|nr:DUF726 domain-containing protein [Enterobacter roggenkampii]ELK6489448.1 DUF726 domain-containing protein [Enterobacter bugandensis]MCK6840199.1 TMCO4 family protein [Enterobacter roggenkampii]HDT2127961.1 DUF726 domain-containing protein [Enterobacter roggenkampii]